MSWVWLVATRTCLCLLVATRTPSYPLVLIFNPFMHKILQGHTMENVTACFVTCVLHNSHYQDFNIHTKGFSLALMLRFKPTAKARGLRINLETPAKMAKKFYGLLFCRLYNRYQGNILDIWLYLIFNYATQSHDTSKPWPLAQELSNGEQWRNDCVTEIACIL